MTKILHYNRRSRGEERYLEKRVEKWMKCYIHTCPACLRIGGIDHVPSHARIFYAH